MGRMPQSPAHPYNASSDSVGLGVVTCTPAKAYFDEGTSCLRQGRYDEAQFYLRESLRMQPDDPDTLNNLGTVVWLLGRADEAEGYYRCAFKIKPHDYSIVNNLGNALWEQCRLEEAAQFYRNALELKPHSSETWMNLGVLLTDLAQFDEAVRCIQESLRIRPDAHEAHDNLGATLFRQGKWDEALACYDRALKLQPYYAESHRNRAFVWLARGDFERGWPEFEWRLNCRRHVGYTPNRPRWNGEELSAQTILLHAEQGLGDTIQFIRFVAEIRKRGAGQVVVICPQPLVRLIASFPGIDVLVGEGSPIPSFDVHASLCSLPAILRITLANLPTRQAYLSVDEVTRARWRAILAGALGETGMNGGIKIGVVWQGNPKHRTDRFRSFQLSHLEPLAHVPGVRLISLQKDHGLDQLPELDGRFPVVTLANPTERPEDDRDLLDTAAIVSQLDMVVTPDSAVAHLAGSLGKAVWVGLPSIAEWRWMIDREDSPWYPSMRLFRQNTPGDWPSVFERMANVLRRESTDAFAKTANFDMRCRSS
jgi:tetratricopeptide (TPR) repeat protein